MVNCATMSDAMHDGQRLLEAIRAVSATSADRAGDEGTFLDRVNSHADAIRRLGEVLDSVLSEDELRRLMFAVVDKFTDPLDPRSVEAASYIMDGVGW